MVIIKTPEQIQGIRKSCRLLSKVMRQVRDAVKPGITPKELDELTEKLIVEAGGRPSFKGYKSSPGGIAFPSSLCTSINDIVVHGQATSDDPLKDGDIVGLDCGVDLDGYYSDMAISVPVGKVDPEIQQLLAVGQEALINGIEQMRPGNTVRDISQAIQDTVKPHGYGIVRSFAGHGVGLHAHEDPWIANYVDKSLKHHLDIELKPGMIFALEPMISLGDGDVEVLDDGWSVRTKDRSVSVHFEHTVLITEDGFEILTK